MPFVESDDPNEITLDVLTASGQVVNALRIRDRDGNVLLALDKDGKMEVLGGIELAGLFLLTGNIGLTGNLTQTGDMNVVGGFRADGLNPLYDYIVRVNTANTGYEAWTCKTGLLLIADADRSTVYEAAISALIADHEGCGVILDLSGYTSPYPYVNYYYDGIPFDTDLMLDEPLVADPDIVFSNFDVADEWGVGVGTLETDADLIINGKYGLRITLPQSSTISLEKTFSPAVDIRRMSIYLRCWLENLNGGTAVEFKATSDAWGNYVSHYLSRPVNYTVEGSNDGAVAGWWESQDSALARLGFNGANFDPSAVTAIRLVFYGSATAPSDVVLDTLQGFRNRLRRGTVVLSHDEGQLVWDHSRPVLDKYGDRISIGWESQNLLDDGEDMPDALAKLARYKQYEVGTHGYGHYNTAGMTRSDALRRNLRDLRAMKYYGIHSNSRAAISAGGATGYEWWCSNRAYSYLNRGTLSQYSTFPLGGLGMIAAVQDPSLADAKSMVDEVATGGAREGSCIHMLVHKVYAGATPPYWTPAEWEELIDYIHSKNVDFLTYGDLVNMYLKRGKKKSPLDEMDITFDGE